MGLVACDVVEGRPGEGPLLRALVDLGLPCNLGCPSCPRLRARAPARGATATLAAQVVREVEEADIRRALAVWYGGEPLLDLEDLVRASGQVRAACARRGAAYDGCAISNGTLLDERAASALAAAGIGRVQVTLAGSQPVHDARRPLLGMGSYRLVLRNLRAARLRLGLVIRFDLVGAGSMGAVADLVRVLEEEGLFEDPHPATVILGRPGSYAAQARALLDFGLPGCFVPFPDRSPDPLPA